MQQLTRPERYAVARCWRLWQRWLAYERHERAMGRPAPDRDVLRRLMWAIRQEMTSDE